MPEQPLAALKDYVIRVYDSLDGLSEPAWDGLARRSADPSPFVRYAYLDALHRSASAAPDTGWTARYITLWAPSGVPEQHATLLAACPLYLKDHSYGEYVFDWSWAQAYERHGLAYYPKALVAIPFTPVPGARLLARDALARQALMQAVLKWCEDRKTSSLHLLFLTEEDQVAALAAGLMLRHTVQFHWTNAHRTKELGPPPSGLVGDDTRPNKFCNFEEFLGTLNQEKRKKIRQERRKVASAGVSVRAVEGSDITPAQWDFFFLCYTRTYLEHGNNPYLTRDFFARMANGMAANWVLFLAEREGHAIACSLLGLGTMPRTNGHSEPSSGQVAYGRYWGALERVDCLHFELCYYAPIEWCIAKGVDRFEGGAQGEHKMARALMPVKTTSAHWLALPAFSEAVKHFLDQEQQGVVNYMSELDQRSPIKKT